MAYRLTKFDGVSLEHYNVTQDIGTAESALFEVRLAGGGAFDADGEARARALYPRDVTYAATLYGETYEELVAAFNGLATLRGKKGLLERTAKDTDTTQTCSARLVGIEAQRAPRQGQTLPVRLTWRVWGAWQGPRTHESAVWNSGYTWDSGVWLWGGGRTVIPIDGGELRLVQLHNGGNAVVRDIRLEIDNIGEHAIHSIDIRADYAIDLSWTGEVLAGESLHLDCGNFAATIYDPNDPASDEATTITVNGVVGGTKARPQRGHRIPEWIRLEPESVLQLYVLPANTTNPVTASVRAIYQYAYE